MARLHKKLRLESPTVYVLGAGFTRSALLNDSVPPPPLDKDFLEIASQLTGHGTPTVFRRVISKVWDLYQQRDGITLETFFRDLETRDVLDSFSGRAKRKTDWEGALDDVVELIRRTIIHTTCNIYGKHNKGKSAEKVERLLANLVLGDSLVTFNYDLLLEESFGDSPIWSPVDGYGTRLKVKKKTWAKKWLVKRGQAQKYRSKVMLFKLHGSINWRLGSQRRLVLKDFPYFVRTKNKKPAYENVAILAPGWIKRAFERPYDSIWANARDRLERARSIVIIGYSLPETDLLALAMFQEMVRQRRIAKRPIADLHLVDPSDATKQKFVSLLSPAFSKSTTIYRYGSLDEFVDRPQERK